MPRSSCVADQMIGVVSLEGETEQGRDRPERDVALVPVQPQAEHFAALELPLQIMPRVDHRGRVGAGFRTGQAKAGNIAAVGKPRQPLLLLLFGAEPHQEFAGSERIRHHHGDGGGQRARRDLAHHFGMGVRREAEPAIFLRDDHAEEFLPLDEIPGFRRQIAPFPIDLPVVEHRAEFVDRAVEEGRFLCGQRRRRVGEQFRPVGIAGEQIGVPPDVAGLQRLALGVRHRRQHATRPGENRLGDEVAAKAHGDVLMGWDDGAISGVRRRRTGGSTLAESVKIEVAFQLETEVKLYRGWRNWRDNGEVARLGSERRRAM